MTNCVAAVCDNGNALVMVADKMIGMGYVESELEVTKMRHCILIGGCCLPGDDFDSSFRHS